MNVMTPFDPYHKWLGIPADQQPANYYRLLGIKEFEADADVIEGAAERQTIYLRTFQTGPNSELAARLLNEVSAARVCLLDGKSKALYDTQLRAAQQAVTEEDPLAFMAEELAAISSKPGTRSQSRSGRPVAQQPWAISVGAVGIVVVLLLVIVFFGSGDTYTKEPDKTNENREAEKLGSSPNEREAAEEISPLQAALAKAVAEKEMEESVVTLQGHSGVVSCVAFSPDGKRIIRGRNDNKYKINKSKTGRI